MSNVNSLWSEVIDVTTLEEPGETVAYIEDIIGRTGTTSLDDAFGRSVALSSDGNVLAIGANGATSYRGRVSIKRMVTKVNAISLANT